MNMLNIAKIKSLKASMLTNKENLSGLNKSKPKKASHVKITPIHDQSKTKIFANATIIDTPQDPQLVEEYSKEIFEHIRKNEKLTMPKHSYMESQPHINEKMREILIDWMEDVNVKFRLLSETLFMAVNLLDRYLSLNLIARDKLQLLGITTLFIASKYEEIYPPHIKEYIRVCDKAFTEEELIEMEAGVINSLKFKLTSSSSLRFIERYSRVAKLSGRQHTFSRYLIELGLISYDMIKFPASQIAASSVYLVNKIFKLEEWPKKLESETGYDLSQVRECAKCLYILLYKAEGANLNSVKRKYSSKQYMEISKYKIEFRKPIRA